MNRKEARSEEWVCEHFKHLRRPYRYDDLLREDVLGIRDQCVAWMGCEAIPVLCLRYETLWEHADALYEFTGLDVQLPERRPRAAKQVDPALMETAMNVYGPIDSDVSQLPDCLSPHRSWARGFGSVSSLLTAAHHDVQR